MSCGYKCCLTGYTIPVGQRRCSVLCYPVEPLVGTFNWDGWLLEYPDGGIQVIYRAPDEWEARNTKRMRAFSFGVSK